MVACTHSELQRGLGELLSSLPCIGDVILSAEKLLVRLSARVNLCGLTLLVQIHEGVELLGLEHRGAVVEILLVVRYHLLAIGLLFVRLRMRVNGVSQAQELYGMRVL